MGKRYNKKVFDEVMKGLRDRTPTPAERKRDAESAKRIKAERERLGRIAAKDRAEQAKQDKLNAQYEKNEKNRRKNQGKSDGSFDSGMFSS